MCRVQHEPPGKGEAAPLLPCPPGPGRDLPPQGGSGTAPWVPISSVLPTVPGLDMQELIPKRVPHMRTGLREAATCLQLEFRGGSDGSVESTEHSPHPFLYSPRAKSGHYVLNNGKTKRRRIFPDM